MDLPFSRSPTLLRRLLGTLPGKLGVLGGVLGAVLRRLPGRVPFSLLLMQGLQISAATYRGAKCPTAEKQPKNSRKGCRVGHGETAEKQPEKHPKHPKNSSFDCFRVDLCSSFPGTPPAPRVSPGSLRQPPQQFLVNSGSGAL